MHQPTFIIDDLFAAVERGDRDALEQMLDQDPTLAGASNSQGLSLILHAMYHGQREIAQRLAVRSTALDIFDASAGNALKRAVELVRLDRSVLSLYSPDGWTALHLAAFFGNDLLVEYYVASGADVNAVSRNDLRNTPLNAATAASQTAVVRHLLKKGATVNAAQHGGVTPLHSAAFNGSQELVQLLLEHGADRGASDDQGHTPYDIAHSRGHTHLLPLLSQGGRARNNHAHSPD